jgi:general secretion pathway protein E/type IV pilus assembly protein PilB
VTPCAATGGRRPLGETLVALGLIGTDQLRIALLEQAKTRQPLGRLLVGLGFVAEASLREALGEALGVATVDLACATVNPAALRLVPRALAIRHRLLPLDYCPAENRLAVAMADGNDVVALDRLRAELGGRPGIDALLAGETEIARAIDRYYGHELSIEGILREIETGDFDAGGAEWPAAEYSQPMVRLIDALLTDAVKREASDIHFEPEAGFLRIRYRLDGMLRQIRVLHKSCWPAMAVRLKVMSGMNIAETRAPQDGRISMNISGRPVDFRAAVQPTLHGENLVLRILDRHKGIVPIEALGLDSGQLAILRRMIARPEGIVLVTGPTGSGKTTTLYSLLNHLNREDLAIMTLEDPVEYPMAMIRQTSIAEVAKLDFANGIRSMMRQDPDVILVGEIRDAETAEMAFRAAMTGHQVFSTLHTSSAVGALPRLLDIGIQPDILAGNIIGIVAQRLLRRLCPHCRRDFPAGDRERRLFGDGGQALTLYRAGSCQRCEGQGYRGRLAIMELLRVDSDIDELIARRATARELLQASRAKGLRTLAEDGLRLVAGGTTSIDELARVVDLTERY